MAVRGRLSTGLARALHTQKVSAQYLEVLLPEENHLSTWTRSGRSRPFTSQPTKALHEGFKAAHAWELFPSTTTVWQVSSFPWASGCLLKHSGLKNGMHAWSVPVHVSRGFSSSSDSSPSPDDGAGGNGWEERSFEFITAEAIEDGTVGLITLARPNSLNALSEGTMWEVLDALTSFDSLPSVGAMVITGEGKAFAAGADIKEMLDKGFVEAYTNDLLGGWQSLANIRKPVIAAVDGYALGGGCEVAMMCDIVLAGERAIFGQPEVKLGVIPGMGGTQRLVRAVGKARAMEMVLTGEAFLNAEEAVQAGLASRLVKGAQGSVLAEAIVVAKKIARLSRPAVQMAKEAVNSAFESNLQEGLKRERLLFHAAFGLEDKSEGMKAFVEKRLPVFQNK